MATSNTTLQAPLGDDVWADTAVTNSLVDITGGTTVYHFELDNTANAAITYYKFYNSASGSVTLGTTEPSLIIPVPATTKGYMSMPTALTFTAISYIATSTISNATSQSAPAQAVGLRLLYT
jgi:hypothetical protein